MITRSASRAMRSAPIAATVDGWTAPLRSVPFWISGPSAALVSVMLK
ncbi:hypothetical protein ABZX34_10885 [Streptomyces sp. NPDC004362]